MNIHYKNYPTDYIDSLKNKGKRLKARCFWEYFDDAENHAVNSIGFYAKSWGGEKPMSKGTVHKWVKEFVDEIEKHYAARSFMHQKHYTSVKKQSERQVNAKRTKQEPQSPTVPKEMELGETVSERQVNKALTLNSNNNASAIFEGFYFLYRQFNKYAGNKADAKVSFMEVDDVDINRLSVASMFYLKDDSVEKKVGAKKFIDNRVYLNYMEMYLKVFVNGVWIVGSYDTKKEIFTSTDGMSYALEASILADKFAKQEIEILKRIA